MSKRVVITGLGLITPLAANVEDTWARLINGESGIQVIDKFDVSDLVCKIGGQVPLKSESCKHGLELTDYIAEKEIQRMDSFIHYGIAAATQAIEDSGFVHDSKLKDVNPDRIGIVIGSGIGGLPRIEETAMILNEKGPRKVSPFFIPASLINLTSGHISIKYGITGPNESAVTACATGAHAIVNSARMIKLGEADVVVAGSSEATLCRLAIAGFAAARALSTKFNDDPKTASRPWDQDRDGFVMGEGAGVVILEEYEHAKKRGAKIYAELLGYGLSGDAHHITAPCEDGAGGAQAMRLALKSACINPSDIGYINAHGTSTKIGDQAEVNAIKNVFDDHAYKLPVSSTKSSIGHLLGAAGSVEAIFCILALNQGVVPPTLNLDNPSKGCDLNFVPKEAQKHKLKYALSNSFGFGGTNASLIFGKVEE